MACEDCDRAARDIRGYALFSLGCTTCGARALWFIRARLRITPQQKAERMKANLQDWVNWGHSEQQLRALEKQDWGRWAHEHRDGD